MSAARYDFQIEQGFDFTRVLTWKDADQNPIDLSGYSAKLQARPVGATDAVISLNDVSGISLGGIAGTITLHLEEAATTALDFDIMPYTLAVYSGTGTSVPLLRGYITLVKESING